MRNYKIAIVGLGSMGTKHARVIRRHFPEIKIVALRSGIESAELAPGLVDDVVYTLPDLYKQNVDAAILAGPATTRFAMAVALAKNKIHLLIEKPLFVDLTEARDFYNKVNSIGICVKVGYVLRYSNLLRTVEKALTENTFGQILHVRAVCSSYLPNWRPDRNFLKSVSARADLGGGVVAELVHELNYLQHLFGEISPVWALSCSKAAFHVDVEEVMQFIGLTANGTQISVHLDFNSHLRERRFVITGKKKSADVNFTANKLSIYSSTDVQNTVFDDVIDDMLLRQFDSFISSIVEGDGAKEDLTAALNDVTLMSKLKSHIGKGQMIGS
jgi:predicted dehydrogenase